MGKAEGGIANSEGGQLRKRRSFLTDFPLFIWAPKTGGFYVCTPAFRQAVELGVWLALRKAELGIPNSELHIPNSEGAAR